MDDLYAMSDAVLYALPADGDPFENALGDDIKARNAVSAYWHSLTKDSPGKVWWNAEIGHPAVYRALKVDRADPVASYAVAPFRLAKIEDRHVILAAWPPLPNLTECRDWLSIEQVIVWNPTNNSASILGDIVPQTVGAFPNTDTGTVYASPFAFFRAWLEDRAAFLTAYQASKSAHWQTPPAETFTPGLLIVGDPDKVRWRPSELPPVLECVGIDPAKLNRSILRAARLPRCTSSMKAAA